MITYLGTNICSWCKSIFTTGRRDKEYCSIRCQSAYHYAKRRKQKYCVVCKVKCDRKYCTKKCQLLLYRLKRNRKAVDKISNYIRVRRWHRAERKYGSTFISTRGTNIKV